MLTDSTKQELINQVVQEQLDVNFSDRSYIRDLLHQGSYIGGYDKMSDQELIDEYECFVDEDDELLVKAKQEIEIEKTLS